MTREEHAGMTGEEHAGMIKGASWGSNEELRPPLILSCRKPLAAFRYLLAWHFAVKTTIEKYC